MNNKVALGKFYTVISPFKGKAWDEFSKIIKEKETILEPFAGSNNIPKMLSSYSWTSYDIKPDEESVIQRDTLKNFPTGYRIAITNPPYLDVRTARQKKLPYNSEYSDLYLESIKVMLDNCDYIAAIIPATFINKKVFKERLWMWDRIDKKIFSDTGASVGVAYFCKEKIKKTKLFLNGNEVPEGLKIIKGKNTKFNCEEANLTACLIDSTSKKTIELRTTEGFNFEKYLDPLSRYYVALRDERISYDDIDAINNLIKDWREKTNDYYLSPFKSTLPDGTYRKRMSFGQLSGIIDLYVEKTISLQN